MRGFQLETIDKTQYDSFELVGVYEDEYGKYWLAKVEKNEDQYLTGNYYCILE